MTPIKHLSRSGLFLLFFLTGLIFNGRAQENRTFKQLVLDSATIEIFGTKGNRGLRKMVENPEFRMRESQSAVNPAHPVDSVPANDTVPPIEPPVEQFTYDTLIPPAYDEIIVSPVTLFPVGIKDGKFDLYSFASMVDGPVISGIEDQLILCNANGVETAFCGKDLTAITFNFVYGQGAVLDTTDSPLPEILETGLFSLTNLNGKIYVNEIMYPLLTEVWDESANEMIMKEVPGHYYSGIYDPASGTWPMEPVQAMVLPLPLSDATIYRDSLMQWNIVARDTTYTGQAGEELFSFVNRLNTADSSFNILELLDPMNGTYKYRDKGKTGLFVMKYDRSVPLVTVPPVYDDVFSIDDFYFGFAGNKTDIYYRGTRLFEGIKSAVELAFAVDKDTSLWVRLDKTEWHPASETGDTASMGRIVHYIKLQKTDSVHLLVNNWTPEDAKENDPMAAFSGPDGKSGLWNTKTKKWDIPRNQSFIITDSLTGYYLAFSMGYINIYNDSVKLIDSFEGFGQNISFVLDNIFQKLNFEQFQRMDRTMYLFSDKNKNRLMLIDTMAIKYPYHRKNIFRISKEQYDFYHQYASPDLKIYSKKGKWYVYIAGNEIRTDTNGFKRYIGKDKEGNLIVDILQIKDNYYLVLNGKLEKTELRPQDIRYHTYQSAELWNDFLVINDIVLTEKDSSYHSGLISGTFGSEFLPFHNKALLITSNYLVIVNDSGRLFLLDTAINVISHFLDRDRISRAAEIARTKYRSNPLLSGILGEATLPEEEKEE